MSSSNTSRWPRSAFALVVLLLCAVPVSAQTAINPSGVEFPPSPDHAGTKLDLATGLQVPLVNSYEFTAVAMNSVGAIALTVNLGKPTPTTTPATGCAFFTLLQAPTCITVAGVTQLSTISPNVLYTMTIVAIGPDGRALTSPPSNSFGRATPQIPGAVPSVRVR